jgi:hypothetical protein
MDGLPRSRIGRRDAALDPAPETVCVVDFPSKR